MKIEPLSITGAWLVQSQVFKDNRGSFSEWFKKSTLNSLTNEDFQPVQANISISQAGVIRGIHYSLAPQGQAKLVTVLSGSIRDVAIDVRVGSPTFGKYATARLEAGDGKSIFLRSDLAHAFQSLEENTVVTYLVSSEYDPANEKEITPLCPSLQIRWDSYLSPILSVKDSEAPNLLQRMSDNSLPYFR